MAMVSGTRSTLNPNAPLFIPAAFRQVEDFSPEWWDLVKTSTWFRDHWLDQHQEGYEEDEEDDIANLLPDTFDLSGADEFSDLEFRLEETVFQGSLAEKPLKEKLPGIEIDGNKIVANLNSIKSPKAIPAKYWEKPAQRVSPRCSPRPIQQPR